MEFKKRSHSLCISLVSSENKPEGRTFKAAVRKTLPLPREKKISYRRGAIRSPSLGETAFRFRWWGVLAVQRVAFVW